VITTSPRPPLLGGVRQTANQITGHTVLEDTRNHPTVVRGTRPKDIRATATRHTLHKDMVAVSLPPMGGAEEDTEAMGATQLTVTLALAARTELLTARRVMEHLVAADHLIAPVEEVARVMDTPDLTEVNRAGVEVVMEDIVDTIIVHGSVVYNRGESNGRHADHKSTLIF